jgi:hypothetical protein
VAIKNLTASAERRVYFWTQLPDALQQATSWVLSKLSLTFGFLWQLVFLEQNTSYRRNDSLRAEGPS